VGGVVWQDVLEFIHSLEIEDCAVISSQFSPKKKKTTTKKTNIYSNGHKPPKRKTLHPGVSESRG